MLFLTHDLAGAVLRIEFGGQSTISEDDDIEGARELVIEIAASSASLDSGAKLNAYQRNKAQEHLLARLWWRV